LAPSSKHSERYIARGVGVRLFLSYSALPYNGPNTGNLLNVCCRLTFFVAPPWDSNISGVYGAGQCRSKFFTGYESGQHV